MRLGELCRRVWYLLNRTRFERELEDEMASHRAMMRNPLGFGNPLKLREASRDAWGWTWLDRAAQDLRHGARVLRRAPAFAITSILILSAGIGLNLTFFQLLNVTMLQPPAVHEPETLVRLERRGKTFSSTGVPYPATQFIRRHNDVLAAVLVETSTDIVWEDDPGDRVEASFVSANWFSELGYGPHAGRVFLEALDERADAPPVVVVSHDFWRTRLGSDARAVGRPVRINDRIATIVGVAPADFPDLDLRNPRVWLLIHQVEYFDPGSAFKEAWGDNNAALYARLRPGVSAAAAPDGLKSTIAALAQARPANFKADEWLEASSGANRFLNEREIRKMWTTGSLIATLTLLVLVVASANLGNLVLSHAIGRLREFSVRSALGATRWRILRHMLVECGLVAMLGAAGGVALASGGARLLASVTELPPYLDFTPDWRLLAAASAVALVAMLAFGLIPAWMVSRRDLINAMKDGGQQTSHGLARARFRLALVAVQVVGCCALLIVAGSLVRGLQRLLAADPGFAFERVAVLDASLSRHGVDGAVARAYWSDVALIADAHPDVEGVALAYPAPLGGMVNSSRYGHDAGGVKVAVMRVEPGFFQLLEIPIIAGRNFGPGDDGTVVIISRRLAMLMYGSLDVLGQRFPKTKPNRTVIGIAGDASIMQLRAADGAEEYMPLAPSHFPGAVLIAKARTDPQALLQPLRAAARAADSRVLPKTRLLANDYATNLRGPRLASAIAGLVAALVLTLACLGIFGVVAYAVKLRTKEIGIRRALGADAAHVYGTLLRQIAWPVGLGMTIGMAAGFGASKLLGGEPFYLAVTEARVPVAALAVFAIAGLAAALIPASRGVRADPVRALRHE